MYLQERIVVVDCGRLQSQRAPLIETWSLMMKWRLDVISDQAGVREKNDCATFDLLKYGQVGVHQSL